MDEFNESRASQTVLIVDDEQVNREVLKSLLEDEGYRVVVAENGRDGISKSTPDVAAILMDVMMPQMDGLTTCRHLTTGARTRDIPVLLLSACPKDQFLQAAYSAGAYDFISKPVHLSELRAKLAAAIRLDPHRPREQRLARYQELVRQVTDEQVAEEAAVNNLLDQARFSGI